MRAIFLFLMFLSFAAKLSAQHSFIRELPVRGTPNKMYQTADKGFLLAAQLSSTNVGIFKYDLAGNLIKTRFLLNGVTAYVWIVTFTKESDQSFLLFVSRSDSGNCLYRIDIDGNISGTILLSNKVSLQRIQKNIDKSFMALGIRPGSARYIYKLDTLFDITDSVLFPNTASYNLQVHPTGDMILSGPMDNPFFPTTIYYYIFDKELNLISSRTYMDKDHIPLPVADGWLFYFKGLYKLNHQLDSVWYHPLSDYKFTGTLEQEATDMKELPDGGFIMTGKVWNSFFHTVYLIRVDEQGNLIWKEIYEMLADNVVSVEATDDGGYVMFQSGQPDSTNEPRMFLVKTNGDGTLGIHDTYAQTSLGASAYPNPSRDRVNILFKDTFSGSLQLFDVMGKLLYTEELWGVSSHRMDIASYLSCGCLISAGTGWYPQAADFETGTYAPGLKNGIFTWRYIK